VLRFITMGLQTWLPQGVNNYRDAVMFGIVILVLLIMPHGLVKPTYLKEAR
jgi:branched-subunit amino acid ABC-type transport system permease component